MVLALAVVGGSYLWLYLKVGGTMTTDSSLIGAVEETFAGAIDPPTGMDILVLGADKRAGSEAGIESRSDTVILVHVDPDSKYLSILSLPRDLRVEVPGHGVNKLNYAYAAGGATLTTETVQQLTNIDVDAYVEIDFKAFQDLTDRLGGVYVDIDRRYYNDSAESDWELIRLSPGYQLLNGSDALDYVRFRHDSNYDFGRMERQQRFLVAAKEQVRGWDLLRRLPGLVDALCDNVETTIGAQDMLELAYWGIGLDGSRIRQVSIAGDIQTVDGVSYVIPAEGAVEEAVDKLMTAPDVGGSGQTADSSGTSFATEGSTPTISVEDSTSLITDPDEIPNGRLWALLADVASFPLMAPGYLPQGYGYVDHRPQEGETYQIVPGDTDKAALKVVYQLTREGEALDQYMGIMETAWLDAPAASPGQEVEHNGIIYTIVGTNQRVDRIWWRQNDTLYWVSNTLSFYLSKKELLKVAQSMIEVPEEQSSLLIGRGGLL